MQRKYWYRENTCFSLLIRRNQRTPNKLTKTKINIPGALMPFSTGREREVKPQKENLLAVGILK